MINKSFLEMIINSLSGFWGVGQILASLLSSYSLTSIIKDNFSVRYLGLSNLITVTPFLEWILTSQQVVGCWQNCALTPQVLSRLYHPDLTPILLADT